MHTLILFEKKNVSFFTNATVWLLRQYSLFLLAPDIQLCSSFTLYTFFYTFYMIFVYKYVWSVYRGIKIKSTNVYVFIRIVYFILFFFLFPFFLLRIFCQKNIFASPNLEITSHFAKCEAIIRTLEFENTFGEFDEAEQGCYKA